MCSKKEAPEGPRFFALDLHLWRNQRGAGTPSACRPDALHHVLLPARNVQHPCWKRSVWMQCCERNLLSLSKPKASMMEYTASFTPLWMPCDKLVSIPGRTCRSSGRTSKSGCVRTSLPFLMAGTAARFGCGLTIWVLRGQNPWNRPSKT